MPNGKLENDPRLPDGKLVNVPRLPNGKLLFDLTQNKTALIGVPQAQLVLG